MCGKRFVGIEDFNKTKTSDIHNLFSGKWIPPKKLRIFGRPDYEFNPTRFRTILFFRRRS